MTPEARNSLNQTIAKRWMGSRSLATFYGTDNRYYMGDSVLDAAEIANSNPSRLPSDVAQSNLFGGIIKGIIGGLNPISGAVLAGTEIAKNFGKKDDSKDNSSGTFFGIDFGNIAKSITLALIGGAILIVGLNVLSYEGFQAVRGTNAGRAVEKFYTKGLSEKKKESD